MTGYCEDGVDDLSSGSAPAQSLSGSSLGGYMKDVGRRVGNRSTPRAEHLPSSLPIWRLLKHSLIILQPQGPPSALGLSSPCSAPPRTFICSGLWQGHSFYSLCLINVLLSFHPFSWCHSLRDVSHPQPHPFPGAWFIPQLAASFLVGQSCS